MIALWIAIALAADIEVPGDAATLAEAIDRADPGDTVLLAEGRHEGGVTIAIDLTIAGVDGTVVHVDRVGTPVFAVTDGTVVFRDLTLESTTSRGVDASGGSVTLEDVSASAFAIDGPGAVVRATGAALTITGGTFTGNTADGGVVASHDGDLAITAAAFTDNAGSAVAADGTGALTVTATDFERNDAADGGAGLRVGDGRAAVIESSRFAANTSSFGTAIRVTNGDLTVRDTTIEGYADPPPPSETLVRVDVAGTVRLEGCDVRGGRAGFHGGGFDIVSAGVVDVVDTDFVDNEAGWSGAALRGVSVGTLVITGGAFEDNRVTDPVDGGAIRVESGHTVEITGVRLVRNTGAALSVETTAPDAVATIALSELIDNTDAPEGNALLRGFAEVTLDGNRFYRNTGVRRAAASLPSSGAVTSIRNRYCANDAEIPALYAGADSFGTANDLFAHNVGTDGIVVLFGPDVWTATHSTFIGNTSVAGGVFQAHGGILSVDASVFVDNDVPSVIAADDPEFPIVQDDLFWGNTGELLGGDLAAVLALDPSRNLFVDPGYRAYDPLDPCEVLQVWPAADSPLLDAGPGDDPDGSPADLGHTGGSDADPALWRDADGDGVVFLWDCDDSRPEAFPGADELCNDLDDDCDGLVDEEVPVDAPTWFLDDDGDGFGGAPGDTACDAPDGQVATSDDCDDARADVYPGADERCDGVDGDCDGAVDAPDPVDAATFYADADGDGFGDEAVTVEACAAPDGHVDDATDCDDTSDAVFPGAVEVCNGVDDDCEGTVDVDAVDRVEHWPDADGDGWGVPGDTVFACEPPPGHADRVGDCDDVLAGVNPDATEIPGNGVDEDCDGEDGWDGPTGGTTSTSPTTPTTPVDTGGGGGGGGGGDDGKDPAPVQCGCDGAPSTVWLALLAPLIVRRRRSPITSTLGRLGRSPSVESPIKSTLGQLGRPGLYRREPAVWSGLGRRPSVESARKSRRPDPPQPAANDRDRPPSTVHRPPEC